MVKSGSVIGGRYRLDRMLGEGGMGSVWAATHTLTNKRVAIKMLKADIASPETLRRFVREARAASAVRHPNVVEVHDILSLDDGSPAMVMDFLEGETLAQFLERSGRIELADLAAIMAPVLSAVGSAHAVGIVHRDLKPDNIFLARLGDGRVEPMVLDFGIAKVLPFSEEMPVGTALTEGGTMLGTPLYMAPEQAFGEKDIDARADIWSLGVILYECSSGRKPVDGETLGAVFKMLTTGTPPALEELVPGLPRPFVALVESMMQRERAQRPSDLREPFELLRGWSGSSVPGFGPAISILPPPVSARSDAPTLVKPDPSVAPRPVVSATHGLGASAVPVTKGVGAARRKALTPAVVGVGLAVVLGVAALVAALRDSGAPAATVTTAASIASAALSLPSAAPSPSPSTETLPAAASAAAMATASSSASAAASVSAPAGQKKHVATKANGHRLLPGGVDEAVPF